MFNPGDDETRGDPSLPFARPPTPDPRRPAGTRLDPETRPFPRDPELRRYRRGAESRVKRASPRRAQSLALNGSFPWPCSNLVLGGPQMSRYRKTPCVGGTHPLCPQRTPRET